MLKRCTYTCLTLCVYTVMSRLKARYWHQQEQPLKGNSALTTCYWVDVYMEGNVGIPMIIKYQGMRAA